MNDQVLKKIIDTTRRFWDLGQNGVAKPQVPTPVKGMRHSADSQSGEAADA